MCRGVSWCVAASAIRWFAQLGPTRLHAFARGELSPYDQSSLALRSYNAGNCSITTGLLAVAEACVTG
jgi:hypothetical protein